MRELSPQSNRQDVAELRDDAIVRAREAQELGHPVAAREWLEVARRATYIVHSIEAYEELMERLRAIEDLPGRKGSDG